MSQFHVTTSANHPSDQIRMPLIQVLYIYYTSVSKKGPARVQVTSFGQDKHKAPCRHLQVLQFAVQGTNNEGGIHGKENLGMGVDINTSVCFHNKVSFQSKLMKS